MKKCNWCGFLLIIADALLSTFVIFPLAVLHWEGTWVLQDEYLLPNNNGASTLLSFSIGAVVCTIQLLMQPQLAEWLLKQPPLLYFFITRLHLYVHGWAILCYWRGVWNLLDLFFNSDHPLFKYTVILVYVVCQSLMIMLRTVRTTIGPPVSINLDFSDDLLDANLIFKIHHSNPLWFVFDCLFTQFIIVTLSLTIWWALWWLYDVVIFTDPSQDPLCCFLGGAISFIFLLHQLPLSYISKRLDTCFWCKVAYEDVIFIILTWANLMYWRGFWNMWVEDFMDRKWVGLWFSHVVGTLGLLLLQSLNSTGQHGIDRDGSYPGGTGIFPNKLLTVVFHKHLSQYQSLADDDDEEDDSDGGGFGDDENESSVDSTLNGISSFDFNVLHKKNRPFLPNKDTTFTNKDTTLTNMHPTPHTVTDATPNVTTNITPHVTTVITPPTQHLPYKDTMSNRTT